jgi:secreted trypsin-like serine protease
MFGKSVILIGLVAFVLSSPVPKREGRIIGGSDAVNGQFPYQVALRNSMNGSFFCGASIINNRWVLSAAHCTVNRAQNSLLVVVGSALLNSGGVTHVSSRILNHPNYNHNVLVDDVSVIQTSTDITFNANVQPIALGSAFVGGGVRAVASGWGSTVTGGPAPNNLQYITLTTLNNADCLNRVGWSNREFVPESKICTLTQAGEGICQGDSGGPLAAGNAVIGISSFAFFCALGLPDGFERVASSRAWILSAIS